MKRFCLKCQKRLSKGRNLICTNCLVKENEAQKENIKKEKGQEKEIKSFLNGSEKLISVYYFRIRRFKGRFITRLKIKIIQ